MGDAAISNEIFIHRMDMRSAYPFTGNSNDNLERNSGQKLSSYCLTYKSFIY